MECHLFQVRFLKFSFPFSCTQEFCKKHPEMWHLCFRPIIENCLNSTRVHKTLVQLGTVETRNMTRPLGQGNCVVISVVKTIQKNWIHYNWTKLFVISSTVEPCYIRGLLHKTFTGEKLVILTRDFTCTRVFSPVKFLCTRPQVSCYIRVKNKEIIKRAGASKITLL